MKLAGALAVPLLALVVVTVLEVVQSARDAERVRQQTALAEASVGPVSLLSMLENERNAAAVYLLAQEANFALPVKDNAEARLTVDETLAGFRDEVQSQGGEIADAYRPALDQMGELEGLRTEVDAVPDGQRGLDNIVAVSENFDGYTAVMDALFVANKRVALAIDDADLRRGAELVDLSARQTDIIAILVRDLLLAAVGGDDANGVDTADEVSTVSRHLGELRSNERLIATKGTGMYRPHVEALFAAEEIQRFPQVVDEALATTQVDLDGVITYSAGEDPDTYGYSVFRQSVTESLSDKADELEAAATARQRWFLVLALVPCRSPASSPGWCRGRSPSRCGH